jgi:hypothetical protein
MGRDLGFSLWLKASGDSCIGFEDGTMLATAGSVEMTLVRTDWEFWTMLLLFLLAVGFFLYLAVRSDILRDCQAVPEKGDRKPFSLSRCQMAWWFFIIFASYMLIWIVVGDRDTLSSSALALLGISSATALGAVSIDASKKTDAKTQLQALEQEAVSLTSRVNAIDANTAKAEEIRELADKKARLDQVAKLISELKVTLAPKSSEGFLQDLLTDVNGVTLHRFQIVIWTVTLGFIFALLVYRTLGMPEFSGTLLALMGISNGAYLGFKIPEKQA